MGSRSESAGSLAVSYSGRRGNLHIHEAYPVFLRQCCGKRFHESDAVFHADHDRMDGADASGRSLPVLADQLRFPDRADKDNADCPRQKIISRRKKRRKKEEEINSGLLLIPAFCFMGKREGGRSETCSPFDGV